MAGKQHQLRLARALSEALAVGDRDRRVVAVVQDQDGGLDLGDPGQAVQPVADQSARYQPAKAVGHHIGHAGIRGDQDQRGGGLFRGQPGHYPGTQ